MIKDLWDYNYGWFFATAVVAISTAAIVYGLMLVRETRAELHALRAAGLNGVLEGLTLVSLKAHVIRVAHLLLFNAAGWIVLGVVIFESPPEGALLSLSRSLTLANVCLAAWTLVWGRSVRRDLAEKEATRLAGLTPAAAARVVVTAKDAHDAAVVVEIKAAEAVVSAEDEVQRADEVRNA